MKLPEWFWVLLLPVFFVSFALLGVLVFRLSSQKNLLGTAQDVPNQETGSILANEKPVPEVSGFESETLPSPCQIEVSSTDSRFSVGQDNDLLGEWVRLLGACSSNQLFTIQIPDGSQSGVSGNQVVFDPLREFPGTATNNGRRVVLSQEIANVAN